MDRTWEEGQMRETMFLALFFNKCTGWRAGDSLTPSRDISNGANFRGLL